MASVPDAKKLMLKHQSLKQDFDDLLRETQALKARLQEARNKRLRLIAEVRFLRRRHKLLTCDSSHANTKERTVQPQKSEAPIGTDNWRKSHKEEDVATMRNRSLLDLNQASDSNMEYNGGVQVVWEPLRLEKKAKMVAIEGGDTLANDLRLSICRGVGNGIGNNDGGKERMGKRKISWQDQVALKV
ncbi:hypothetical protein EJ110_NYTH14635 [Nymphaea thermarum]|nr:hypothetical protein EJ110_NYTH14635 [Nymphaea thermarum]